VPQLGGSTLVILQVIWAIGASMVVLAGCQFFGPKVCLVLGVIIVIGHNALDSFWPVGELFGGTDPLWYGLQTQFSAASGPFLIIIGYPILSWIGVMLLGYGTAFVFEKGAEERDRILFRSGLIMIGIFVVIRAIGFYGDPNPWQVHEGSIKATVLDFMNVSKYPPSLLFLLATLGPMAIVCSLADKMTGWLKNTLVMFGRVPFAFYVAHWYVIRLLSLALAKQQGFEVSDITTLFFFFPEGYGVSLGGVYAVWLVVLVILYPFCKWVPRVKSRRRDWWLSYL
jgi:uncharacterized membrane protein